MRIFLIAFVLAACASAKTKENKTSVTSSIAREKIPADLLGDFVDDYDIHYTITDSVWTQHKNIRYHIIRWDTKAKYILARNDAQNRTEPGLYTRIDYMNFENMQPYFWGFCLTVYNAATDSSALAAAQADRANPKKGCNGYPFSRMKRAL